MKVCVSTHNYDGTVRTAESKEKKQRNEIEKKMRENKFKKENKKQNKEYEKRKRKETKNRQIIVTPPINF